MLKKEPRIYAGFGVLQTHRTFIKERSSMMAVSNSATIFVFAFLLFVLIALDIAMIVSCSKPAMSGGSSSYGKPAPALFSSLCSLW